MKNILISLKPNKNKLLIASIVIVISIILLVEIKYSSFSELVLGDSTVSIPRNQTERTQRLKSAIKDKLDIMLKNLNDENKKLSDIKNFTTSQKDKIKNNLQDLISKINAYQKDVDYEIDFNKLKNGTTVLKDTIDKYRQQISITDGLISIDKLENIDFGLNRIADNISTKITKFKSNKKNVQDIENKFKIVIDPSNNPNPYLSDLANQLLDSEIIDFNNYLIKQVTFKNELSSIRKSLITKINNFQNLIIKLRAIK